MRHTFYRMFCESCTVFADGTALVDGEERITYAQLFEGVESEAARLRHIGVRRGDHVALLFPNSARFVVELFALMRLRAVPVPLNWRLTAGEVAEQLVAACCSALIASDDYAALARDALGELSWPVVLLPEGGVLGDDAAVLRLGDAPRIDESPENECALVLFTGGSTGTAKAVAYSDQALVAKILAFKNGDHAYRSDDALLLFSPLPFSVEPRWFYRNLSAVPTWWRCFAASALRKCSCCRLPWWRGSAMPHLAATWRSLMFDA